jgi:hypothetical protein
MTEPYRKLPGRLRGFFRPSSAWAGPDHLLLVRGSRFREEYKRFYYRDVQAIAVARAPRFHVSTRSAAIALVIAIGYLYLLLRVYRGQVGPALLGLGLTALALAAIWIYISATQSCRCRIYTAVSGDDLPSVYRLSTARKFLAELEPLIAQTQGALQGDWAAAAEQRTVGPSLAGAAAEGAMPTMHTVDPGPPAPRRSLVTDLFLATLLADGIVKLAPLPPALKSWLPFVMPLVSIAGAVAVIVYHHRGRLKAGMNRVAVASLIAFGMLYYFHSMSAGITAGVTAAKTGKRTVAIAFPQSRLAQEVGAGFDAILLIVGLIMSLREDDYQQRSITG